MTRETNCPICKSTDYDYEYYSEDCYGVIEQHGFCNHCGYIIEQAYSPVLEGFVDIKKGFRGLDKYYAKNVRKHKRIRRKLNIKGYTVNNGLERVYFERPY